MLLYIMDSIHSGDIPTARVEDRILQWAVGPKGSISSEHCSSCIVKFSPGASAKPPHSHNDCEELIYIMSGSGEMLGKDGVSVPLKTGDFIILRIDEVHMLVNTGQVDMQALCFYSAPTDNSKYDFYDISAVRN